VIEHARGLRLGEEPSAELRILLVLRVEYLHCDRLGQKQVLGSVDHAERSGAEALLDEQLAAEAPPNDRIDRGGPEPGTCSIDLLFAVQALRSRFEAHRRRLASSSSPRCQRARMPRPQTRARQAADRRAACSAHPRGRKNAREAIRKT
jgi:hypothetical protein